MALRFHPRFPFFLLAAVLTLLALYFLFFKEVYKPVHRLEPQEILVFTDDLELDSLVEAARHQVSYLQRQNPDDLVQFGEETVSNEWLLKSVEEFLVALTLKPTQEELNSFLQQNYVVYQAGGREKERQRKMLVTGYYEPIFEGSLTKSSHYDSPIYSPPESLVSFHDEDSNKRVGRYDARNKFVDYWSRSEIESGNLLQGNELAYLKEPFDAFLLHVQGSGRLLLPDNSIRAVRFAGSNGLEYNSIGKLLVDEEKMTLEEVSIPAIRTYLQQQSTDEFLRILYHNPRFIFFSWGDNLGPKGSSGEILTPGRSIAIDNASLPAGTIAYLVSRRPAVYQKGNISGWKKLSRFVFPQDSGAAIKGTGRVDIFWGHGSYAELAANHMKEDGQLYFLVKKGYPGSSR